MFALSRNRIAMRGVGSTGGANPLFQAVGGTVGAAGAVGILATSTVTQLVNQAAGGGAGGAGVTGLTGGPGAIGTDMNGRARCGIGAYASNSTSKRGYSNMVLQGGHRIPSKPSPALDQLLRERAAKAGARAGAAGTGSACCSASASGKRAFSSARAGAASGLMGASAPSHMAYRLNTTPSQVNELLSASILNNTRPVDALDLASHSQQTRGYAFGIEHPTRTLARSYTMDSNDLYLGSRSAVDRAQEAAFNNLHIPYEGRAQLAQPVLQQLTPSPAIADLLVLNSFTMGNGVMEGGEMQTVLREASRPFDPLGFIRTNSAGASQL